MLESEVKGLDIEQLADCANSCAPVRGEVTLWRAVIAQALSDLRNGCKRTEEQIAKNAAVQWLSADNRHFLEVCDLADLSSEKVIKAAQEVLYAGRRIRLPNGGGRKNKKNATHCNY